MANSCYEGICPGEEDALPRDDRKADRQPMEDQPEDPENLSPIIAA